MFNLYNYDADGYHGETVWKVLLALGIIAIFSGLIVLMVPEILIVIIASILFTIGGIIVANAWQLRKISQQGQRVKIRWFD